MREATSRFDRKDLVPRIITAVIAAGAVVGLVTWSGLGLLILCIALSLLAYAEFVRIVGVQWNASYSLLCFLFILTGWSYAASVVLPMLPPPPAWHFMLLGLPVLLILTLFRNTPEEGFRQAALLVFGIAYVAVPFLLLFQAGYLLPSGYDWRLPMGLLVLIWASDVGGYFGGKLFGKHPLFPRVSPKKTWEGLAGSLLLAIGAGVAWTMLFYAAGELAPQWWVMAIIATVVGTLGDLVESMLKRGLGLKDSGGLLPGHGGLLDRFDGFLLAMPVIYVYLQHTYLR